MSICNECWGKGWIEKQGVQFDCRKCKGTGVIENEPQTNDEWRRTCSAEEFAEWLFHYSFDKCNLCGQCWDENICPQCERRSDKDFFEKWLKEKHK